MPDGIQTVLFDLDGTLLDTAPDLAVALNRVLAENRREPLPLETIRPAVSHGGIAIIRRGFGLDASDPAIEPLRQRLLELYSANISTHTRPFPGMAGVLDTLEARGLKWGVVTNKPGWLTQPLLGNLGLLQRAACVVSGDTLAQRKPDPAPMLHACMLADSEPRRCAYVGDALRDVEAGRNAGMYTLVALFGYFREDDRPEDWQADAMLQTPADLLGWLDDIEGHRII